MGSPEIVVGDSDSDLGAGVVEIEEQGFVEQLITHPAVETLDEAVLHRLSRCDEVPIDDCVLAPGEHGIAGEFGAMVGDDHEIYRCRALCLGRRAEGEIKDSARAVEGLPPGATDDISKRKRASLFKRAQFRASIPGRGQFF